LKVGPSSEIDRWQRKQRLLSNLTEQLKTKECKSVVSALITVKSKVLKRWKVIDTGITDAQNECRDKVKFLETLRRSIDQFYHEATPMSCVVTALPGLCTAMRAVESVSRYYARQGYLGLLFTKVTNQLVNVMSEYLLEMSESVEGIGYFWPKIFKELESASFDESSVSGGPVSVSESRNESVLRVHSRRDTATAVRFDLMSVVEIIFTKKN